LKAAQENTQQVKKLIATLRSLISRYFKIFLSPSPEVEKKVRSVISKSDNAAGLGIIIIFSQIAILSAPPRRLPARSGRRKEARKVVKPGKGKAAKWLIKLAGATLRFLRII